MACELNGVNISLGRKKIIKILKLQNNNIVCVYLRKSVCPAGPEDRTWASHLT